MGQKHYSTQRKKRSHITFSERQMLEGIIRVDEKNNRRRKSQRELARALGVSQSSICRELKRGSVKVMDTHLKEYTSYSAEVAQACYYAKASLKGPNLKLGGHHKLAKYIESKILGEAVEGDNSPGKRIRYSPDAIVMELDTKDGWSQFGAIRLCTRTIYNYIGADLFLRITQQDLPRQGRTEKGAYRRVRRSHRNLLGKTIEERPKEADDRSEGGHWEMDCIESGKKRRNGSKAKRKGRACLLTLVERSSREAIFVKLRSQTQKSVLAALDKLERQHGSKTFREKFKSFTVDNGAEFLDCKSLERSIYTKQARTGIYYAHPYSSWERGSNENMNGFIRYFIEKGVMISEYSHKEIANLQEEINMYPRRIQGGLSAQDYAAAARAAAA